MDAVPLAKSDHICLQFLQTSNVAGSPDYPSAWRKRYFAAHDTHFTARRTKTSRVRFSVSMAKATHAIGCCCKWNHTDEEKSRLESHATTVAAMAPKTSPPENT
jgi:hypothetical protein